MSGDKDFIQLQKHSFVKQYSPTLKKYVNGVDPHQYRIEHIFKGDRGDGIPNILSSDNTFVEGIRQKPLGKKKIEEWVRDKYVEEVQERPAHISPLSVATRIMLTDKVKLRLCLDASYINDLMLTESSKLPNLELHD